MTYQPDIELAAKQVDDHLIYATRIYRDRAADYANVHETGTYDEIKKKVQILNATCGAHIGRSVMRSVREVALDELLKIASQKNIDMTVTLAKNAMKRVIGRSVDNRSLIEQFATAGRTASNKTSSRVADFEPEIEVLADFVAALRAEMAAGRAPIKVRYLLKGKKMAGQI